MPSAAARRIAAHLELVAGWVRRRWTQLPDNAPTLRELAGVLDQAAQDPATSQVVVALIAARVSWLAAEAEALDRIGFGARR